MKLEHSEFGVSNRQTKELKHSGLGISAFVISLCAGVLLFFAVIASAVMVSQGVDEESPGFIMLGLFLITLVFAEVLAVGLGIAGLIQENRKKIFAVLGVVVASCTTLLFILLFIVGLAFE